MKRIALFSSAMKQDRLPHARNVVSEEDGTGSPIVAAEEGWRKPILGVAKTSLPSDFPKSHHSLPNRERMPINSLSLLIQFSTPNSLHHRLSGALRACLSGLSCWND